MAFKYAWKSLAIIEEWEVVVKVEISSQEILERLIKLCIEDDFRDQIDSILMSFEMWEDKMGIVINSSWEDDINHVFTVTLTRDVKVGDFIPEADSDSLSQKTVRKN